MENKINIDSLRTFVQVLNKLPSKVKNNEVDMKSLYVEHCDNKYYHLTWTDTLATFLGFGNKYDLKKWAYNNPKLWGNDWGAHMFSNGKAFGQDSNIFKRSVFIKHWNEVLLRVKQ